MADDSGIEGRLRCCSARSAGSVVRLRRANPRSSTLCLVATAWASATHGSGR